MNRLLLGGTAVLVVTGAALLAAPALIDWNRWRAPVAAALELATGREVTIAGDLDLALLPRPVLSARDVRLSLPDGTMVGRAAAVDLSARILPLLRGAVQVDTLLLDTPDFQVTLRRNGDVVLPVDPAASGGAVRVERTSLRGGTLTLTDERGPDPRTATLTDIVGAVEAGGSDGPFHFDGSFTVAGQELLLEVTTGRTAAAAALPLRVTLSLPDRGLGGVTGTAGDGGAGSLRFAGVLDRSPGTAISGELRGEGRRLGDLTTVLAGLTGRPATEQGDGARPADTRPWTLASQFTWADGRILLDGMEAAVGDSRAVGSVEIPLQGRDRGREASLVLSFTALDLDDWTGGDVPALPAGGALTLDLLADAVTSRGDTLREVSLVGRLADGSLDVERAAATLPGGLVVEGAGSLSTPAGGLALDATLTARTENLRAALTWAGMDVAAVPLERLRRAALTTRVQAAAGETKLLDLTGELDGAKLTGAASWRRAGGQDGARPGLGLRLSIDRLDLDAYLPGGLPAPAQVAERLAAMDLSLDLTAGQVTAAGLPITDLALAGEVVAGALTLRRLSIADAAGVTLTAGGSAAGIAPLSGLDLTYTAETAGIAPLFRALKTTPPVSPERLGPVRLTGRLVGNPEDLGVEAELAALGGTITLGGRIADADDTPEPAVTLRAILPEAVDAIRLIHPDWRPARPSLGPVDLYTAIAGEGARWTLAQLQGTLGPVTLRGGTVTLDREGERRVTTAQLTTGPLDLALAEPLLDGGDLSWTKDQRLSLTVESERLTLPDLATPVEGASLSLVAADGALTLESLAGRWRGGEVAAEGRIATAAAETPGLTADLTLSLTGVELPPRAGEGGAAGIGLSGGRLDLRLTGEAAGTDPAALRAALTAQGEVTVADTTLTGLDLARLAADLPKIQGRDAVRALLAGVTGGGSTALATVSGPVTLVGTDLATTGLTARAPAGALTLTGQVDLDRDRMQGRLAIDPEDGPGFALDLSGPVERPGLVVQADALLDWAAARAALAQPPAAIAAPPPASSSQAAPQPAPRPAPSAPAEPKPGDPPPAEEGRTVIRGILDKLKEGSGS